MKNYKKYFSPGRINLIGEHIDYSGGKVLPLAISLGIYAKVLFNDSLEVSAISRGFNKKPIVFNINNFEKTGDYTDYIKAIIFILKKHKYIEEFSKGFEIILKSTLPSSSGLSSSACLELLIIHILNDEFKLGLDDLTMVKLSQEAEREYVGVNCGIMDQFAIGMAKPNKCIYLDTNNLEHYYFRFDLGVCRLVIINTNKPRNLVESKYNERFAQSQEVFQELQKVSIRKSLCEHTLEELDSIKDKISPTLYRRAHHAISENNRVNRFIDALNAHKYKDMGEILSESHLSLRDDYKVSCEEADFIFDNLQYRTGIEGLRIIGAGFGGCMICLVHGIILPHLIIKLLRINYRYYRRFGHRFSFYIAKSSDKTRRLK